MVMPSAKTVGRHRPLAQHGTGCGIDFAQRRLAVVSAAFEKPAAGKLQSLRVALRIVRTGGNDLIAELGRFLAGCQQRRDDEWQDGFHGWMFVCAPPFSSTR